VKAYALVSIAIMAVSLGACAGRPSEAVLIPVNAPVNGEKSVQVLAATTRERVKDSEIGFTADRAGSVNYQQYAIAIPPDHLPGKIEWPSQTPGNPQTDFVVVENRPLSEADFAKAIETQLASRGNKSGDVLVFVHGYNTNHPEAVFRVAELAADLRSRGGAAVLFSWPSRASVTDYVTDRESATYSRDYLEHVLNEIAGIPDVRSIYLVAHSMGNWLAVETLRQAKLRARSPFLKKLKEVVLLAPDIDVNVFRTQLDAIGKLNRPIIVAVSKDDLALATSERLAGGVPRVGNVLIDNPRAQAAIKRYGLDVVDLSQVKSEDYFAHSKFADALPELQNIAQTGGGGRSRNPGAAAGVFVLNGAGQLLSAPSVIGNALLQQ
jgi:esterase/lipase superfamily enzyme